MACNIMFLYVFLKNFPIIREEKIKWKITVASTNQRNTIDSGNELETRASLLCKQDIFIKNKSHFLYVIVVLFHFYENLYSAQ